MDHLADVDEYGRVEARGEVAFQIESVLDRARRRNHRSRDVAMVLVDSHHHGDAILMNTGFEIRSPESALTRRRTYSWSRVSSVSYAKTSGVTM